MFCGEREVGGRPLITRSDVAWRSVFMRGIGTVTGGPSSAPASMSSAVGVEPLVRRGGSGGAEAILP